MRRVRTQTGSRDLDVSGYFRYNCLMPRLKKLIENMLFLAPVTRERLVQSLQYLSAERAEDAYKRFAGLRRLEEKFVAGFLERHPDVAKQIVSEVKQVKKSAVREAESAERRLESGKIDQIFE